MKRLLQTALTAGVLLGPTSAFPALADTSFPPANGRAAAQLGLPPNQGQLTFDVADMPIVGRGIVQMADGTGVFGIHARPDAGPHGGHGDFIWKDSEVLYNGAIRGFQVSGNTATIAGGGGLFDEAGRHRQVRFVATIVAGGPGMGSVDVTYTGRDYSQRCAGTVSLGDILIGGDPQQFRADTPVQDMVQLRDAFTQVHDAFAQLRAAARSQAGATPPNIVG